VGSIRVPASLCGVVGFKPTTGRWPGGGVAPISSTLDTAGVLARSVEDCELIDRIVVKDAIPSGRSDLAGARFAYAPRQYLDVVEPEVEAQFKEAMDRLRDAGAEVVEVDLGPDFSALADRLTWRLFFRETRQSVSSFLRRNDFPVTFEQIYDELEPGIKEVWERMVLPGGPGYLDQEGYDQTLTVDRPELQRRFGAMFTAGGFDALVLPTTPCVAPPIGRSFTVDGREAGELVLAKNTVPASGAGLPGISIPMGRNGNGLPIGLELDGAHGRDRELLDLARCVEAVLTAA
jgi:mandelamide amidase